ARGRAVEQVAQQPQELRRRHGRDAIPAVARGQRADDLEQTREEAMAELLLRRGIRERRGDAGQGLARVEGQGDQLAQLVGVEAHERWDGESQRDYTGAFFVRTGRTATASVPEFHTLPVEVNRHKATRSLIIRPYRNHPSLNGA